MNRQCRDQGLALPTARGTVTLASDGDRDAAARVLGEAFAEGRLTADEHGERARAAYAARTQGELCELTADLPGPVPAASPGAAGRPDRLSWCLVCALVCCPPAGIAWVLAARRRARAARGRAVTAGPPTSGWAGIPVGAGAGRRAEDC